MIQVNVHFSLTNSQLHLDDLVLKFWSLASIPELVRISKEHKECEDNFKRNYFRYSSGIYFVKLPLSPSWLGGTKELDMKKFRSLECKLPKQPSIFKDYMRKYFELCQMDRVSKSEGVPSSALPHYAVIGNQV